MRRAILLMATVGAALPLSAAPSVAVKCGANSDRVWVYDNLATFDVNLRLKCGTAVDVLGLEKGYVRIRTSDGNEGFVAAEAVPASELAALAVPAQPPASTTTAVRTPQTNSAAIPAPAASAVTESMAVTARPISPATPGAQQAAAVPAVAVGRAEPATVYLAPRASAPVPATKSLPARTVSAPAVVLDKAAPVAVASVSVPTIAAPVNIAPQSTVVRSYPAAPAHPEGESATQIIEPAPTGPAPGRQAPAAKIIKAASYTPVAKRPLPALRTPEFSDDYETPELEVPLTQFANCNVYFSAYGVTPIQNKWISEELKKRFPGVCPAPEPSMVDYVVILTHDMDFFTTTLPDPVHTDRNGFSDWSPVMAVDNAQIPSSSLDKARREYAWVFRVHRGTFNPSNFTSRRVPQYTKTESRSAKSIEDAMGFIAGTGSSR